MIKIRLVEKDDLEMLFQWRNIDKIISLSASQRGVSSEEHKYWFDQVFQSSKVEIYIIEKSKIPVGQIRFKRKENKSRECEISIYLLPSEQEKGIGSTAINLGIKKILNSWNKTEKINAFVRKENKASLAFFKKNKFLKSGNSNQLIRLSYYPNKNINKLIKKNVKYYDKRVEKYGNSHLSLNWGSKESQLKRFEILSLIGNLHQKKVLDFGCGLGDLYSWFKENKNELNYTGIDISPEMIKQASSRFPEGQFLIQDIFSVPLQEDFFDYILMSGIFTYTNKFFFERCIELLFPKCKIGLGFNLLGEFDKSDKGNENYEFSQSLEQTLIFCNKITKKIVFHDDYHPRDFTVFLYK